MAVLDEFAAELLGFLAYAYNDSFNCGFEEFFELEIGFFFFFLQHGFAGV